MKLWFFLSAVVVVWRWFVAADDAAVEAYLRAVYPAAGVVTRELFESLDYYYAPSVERAKKLKTTYGNVSVPLPYVPPGVYYSAEAATTASPRRWVLGASYDRWPHPVRVLRAKKTDPRLVFSTVGSRLGPAPSWTNPLAIVKYPWYPFGLSGERKRFDFDSKDFDDDDDRAGGARMRLRAAVRRGLVEVEQFGGPVWIGDECPEKGPCGLWLNHWRGTGTFLRVDPSRTFSADSKFDAATALLESLPRSHVEEISRYVLRRTLTSGKLLAESLFFRGETHPCPTVFKDQQAWERFARSPSSPPTTTTTKKKNASLELKWSLGVCGLGPHYSRERPFAGWDNLLMVLACCRGLKTIVFEKSPNDNGLVHQELVDFDHPGIWPTNVDVNPINRCLPPIEREKRTQQHKTTTTTRRQRDLLAYWNATQKFVLADPGRRRPSSRCDLQLGSVPDDLAADVCRSTHLRNYNGPRPRACFLNCRGAMSEVHKYVADTLRYDPTTTTTTR